MLDQPIPARQVPHLQTSWGLDCRVPATKMVQTGPGGPRPSIAELGLITVGLHSPTVGKDEVRVMVTEPNPGRVGTGGPGPPGCR